MSKKIYEEDAVVHLDDHMSRCNIKKGYGYIHSYKRHHIKLQR